MSENQATRIVVIGASAAGLRAAARARRRLPGAQITVLDKENLISYSACGTPYFVSGDIPGVNKLRETPYGLVRNPDFFRLTKGIEVITGTRVERVDRSEHKVFCRSATSGETSEYSYDKLVLATGASPVMPTGFPGEGKRITTFNTLQNAIDLRKSLETGKIGKVGIVGGGSIGCELAEAFHALWGVNVVLFDIAPHILPSVLDPEMALAVEAYIKSEGVEIHTNCRVEDISESDEAVTIKTDQVTIEADCALIAVGVHPESKLAADCGLALGSTGGIMVDDRMTTSDPDIFAAGDCVEVKHVITGKSIHFPLGSIANRQGRLVGSNLGGGDQSFGPVAGSAAVKIFDMNVAATGLSEKSAAEAGFNAGTAWGTFTDKADFYPEAQNIHYKLVFDKDSQRLLGLQVYGKGEVIKNVDTFAVLLQNEGHLEDLMNLESAYAPPYAPALNHLYSLGCIALDAVQEDVPAISPAAPYDEKTILDVRQAHEIKAMPLSKEDALNIPFEELRERWQEVPGDKPVVCICAKGLRSAESVRFLKEKGFSDLAYYGGGRHMRLPD